jgi:dihydroorotase
VVLTRSSAARAVPLLTALLFLGCNPATDESGDADPRQFDVVFQSARVIDPERRLDEVRNVGIRGDVIAALTEEPLADALADGGVLIDAAGLVLAPGFIDLHAHGQGPKAHEYQARDGVTTALELEWGVPDVESFLDSRRGRSLVNYGATVSHGAARGLEIVPQAEQADLATEFAAGSAEDEPLDAMRDGEASTYRSELPPERFPAMLEHLQKGLEDGALGIGLAHQYYPGATRREIFEVFRFAGEKRATIHTHVRSMSIDAMQEVLANAVATGAPLHIVHVNSMALGEIDTVLELIGGARRLGLDVSTEAYPYTAGSTSLESTIFSEGWQDRLGIDYGDLQWEDTGERLTKETFERYRREGGTVILHFMKEEWIETALANDWVIVASDGMPYAPGAHPRTAGTYSRILGRYVRERGTLDLMTAIRKMSMLPADRVATMSDQMRNKGRVQVGADADIVVFDPDTVIDTATFDGGLSFSEGIVHTMVNGVFVVRDGATVEGVNPGRPVVGRYAARP